MARESCAVEMAGVEPASEEKTIQTATYVVCLLSLAPPDPTDRVLEEPPREARFRRVRRTVPGVPFAYPARVGVSLEAGRKAPARRAT